MNALFVKEFPKIIIRNIIDDGLVKEIIANNGIITSSEGSYQSKAGS